MSVYFARIGAPDGPIKIGYASCTWRRVNEMPPKVRADVTLLADLRGGLKRERYFHRRFAASRIPGKGELFQESPELTAFIAARGLKEPMHKSYIPGKLVRQKTNED